MRNPSPEMRKGVVSEVVRAAQQRSRERATESEGVQKDVRSQSADPFSKHDVHGSSLVAEAFVSGAVSAEERAFLAARQKDGSIPELPQLVRKSEGGTDLSLEPTRRTAYSIKEQHDRVVATRKGEGATNSNAESAEARKERTRAQEILYRQAAEEAVDFDVKKMWMEKAERARRGILAEDGNVDIATIEQIRQEREANRDAIAKENAYDNAGILGKLMMRLRGKGK